MTFLPTSRASDMTVRLRRPCQCCRTCIWRICTLLTPDGRITLADNLLTTTRDGNRQEEHLPDDEARIAARQTHFGIDLTLAPTHKETL